MTPIPEIIRLQASRFGTPVDFKRPLDTSVVRGRFALITGAASGLGLATAKALAAAGACVAVADVQDEAGARVVEELKAAGYSAEFFHVDVTSWESQDELFKAVMAWSHGLLDIVIPAAGVAVGDVVGSIRDNANGPVKPPTAAMEINLTGVYYTSYLALFYFNKNSDSRVPGMAPQLLFVSSIAGYYGTSIAITYCASKFGVRGFWQALKRTAAELGGTQTNLLAPTYVDTPMVADYVALLKDGGVKVAKEEDFVAAAMRAICDAEIDGRAIAVLSGEEGQPGSNNFDLYDDPVDGNGTTQMLAKQAEGRYGDLFG